MKVEAMLGCKLFKEIDNTIDMVRIIKIKKGEMTGNTLITVRNEKTGTVTPNVSVDFLKDYTPLEPDGIVTFNTVNIKNGDKVLHDVIITGSKFLNLKFGDTLPFAVCRQNITDVFYNLLVKDESDMIVGLSVNQNSCPSNFDFGLMLACSEITYTDSINFYRTDMLENDILPMVATLRFDTVLNNLYQTHISYIDDPKLMMKKEHKGWVSDLKTLLKENNFQNDLDEMLGITQINPVIENHIVTKTLPNNEEYSSFDDEMKDWLCSIFKISIDDITVLKYDHDINMADFNNATYLLLRDSTNTLYLVVYTSGGKYHQSDLEARLEKKDFSEEFRINFYNKYNNIK